MLLSEIIYNIKNLISGGIESDDFNLSNSQVEFWVNYYRAKLVTQEQEKGRFDNYDYVQNLGRVELQQADRNECCDIEDCVLRTKHKVPNPLESYQGLNITYVGLNSGTQFQHYKTNAVAWSNAAKYTGKLAKWYYQNGYIYIVNPPTLLLSEINIQGVFEEPRKAEEFRTCDCPNEVDCNDGSEFQYPMPMHHVDVITKLIAQTELNLLLTIPEDITNESMDRIAINGN